MTTTREDLNIELTPPPDARAAAKVIIAGIEESIQSQVLLLASNGATREDPDFHAWLLNQGLLSMDGLDEPEGESILADDYGESTGDIETETERMRAQNDSVNDSAVKAFATTNETYESVIEKVGALNEEMAAAPGAGEGEAHMPIDVEFGIIRSAMTTLTGVVGLVDDALVGMEAEAQEIERNTPGNSGNPTTIWGESSPATGATAEPGTGTVDDILRIAGAEVGRVSEIGGNTAVYADGSKTPYNIDDAWCAAFTSHVWKQAGYDVTWSNPNYVPSIWNDAKGMGLAQDTAAAKPGDLVIFDWQGDGTPDHIGIVEKVEGSQILTIEGNSSDQVKRNEYSMGNADLVGVVKPPSKTDAPAGATPTLT